MASDVSGHPVVSRSQHCALFLATSWLRFWYRIRYNVRIVGNRLDIVPNCVVMTNHRSMLDSFLFGSLLFGTYARRQPWLLPWNAPKRKWYTMVWPIRSILSLFRTVPVSIGDDNQPRDPAALRCILRLLHEGNVVHVFPEGTRSRTETMLPLQATACSLPLLAGSSVLLAYALRYRRMRILVVGPLLKPADLAELAGSGKTKERAEQLARRLRQAFEILDRRAHLATASD